MGMMKGFDTTQALELYRQDVRQAARRFDGEAYWHDIQYGYLG